MLSETYRLLAALRDAGIDIEGKNPRVHSPGASGGVCVRVRLDVTGSVVNVERITENEWPGLWTIREGNHNSFPVVRADLDVGNKSLALWTRLRDEKALELSELFSNDMAATIVRSMADRFRAAAADIPDLIRQIERLLSKLEGIKGRPQLAFDVDGGDTIYRRKIRRTIEDRLPAVKSPTIVMGASALSGSVGVLQRDPFPQVQLPVLNRASALVSMFSDARCNTRYGLTESAIVPVLRDEALALQDALVHVTAADRKGKTWTAIASAKSEQSDLLISLVEGKPEIDEHIADIFGSSPDGDEVQWETDARAVCDALEGIVVARPASRLNLVVVRQVSPGQLQVVLSAAPTVEEVLDGARFWQRAARNLPDIAVPMPREKGQPARRRAPHVPSPNDVVRLLSRQWIALGSDSRTIATPGLGLVLDVMLRRPGIADQSGERLLEFALERTTPLLIGLFGALHTGNPDLWKPYSGRTRQTALLAASAFGILLLGLNRPKEDYMQSQPFLVGRMLSLADTLHREYCIHVRGGAIPPQLIGNALMSAAAENPESALDRLCQRMIIYVAWAKQGQGTRTPSTDGKPRTALAGWAVRQMGQIANDLEKSPLPTRTTSKDRAELLLGYLAWNTSTDQSDTQENNNDDIQ